MNSNEGTAVLTSHFFTNNRRKLAKLVNKGLLVMTAHGLIQRSGDAVYPFRQDSNFFYLTGVKEPDVVLVIDTKTSEEFLVLPKKTQAEVLFGGAIDCDEIAKISGITKILEYKQGWEEIKKLQQSRKKIYSITSPPTKVTHTDNFFTNGNRKQLIEKLKRLHSGSAIEDVRSRLTQLRQIKQVEEIEVIKQAITITADGLKNARKIIKPGITTAHLKAELDYSFTKAGAEHGFTPIVTNGANTCILHLVAGEYTVRGSEPVLFDIGAECELYTADISRTYFSAAPSSRQQAVYDAVLEVHTYACSLLKPGLKWKEYVIAVDEKMGEELIKLGLITKNNRQSVRKYFSHAVSHSLGLDVHDPCNYGDSIQENMVITVEPGIYIPEEKLGVRIEDDVLIAKHGSQNLSSFIPYI